MVPPRGCVGPNEMCMPASTRADVERYSRLKPTAYTGHVIPRPGVTAAATRLVPALCGPALPGRFKYLN